MIIDRIVMENFGVYGGRNEAILTPPSPSQPITLFGGDNGAGKTTLLKALYLAFYGKRAPLVDREGKSYTEFLADCIHSEANPHLGAKIEVHFRKLEDGQEHAFRVTRHWWTSPKGIEERLEVFEDQTLFSELLSENWAEFIEDYLPAKIANLFFFDGEQIKELAAHQSAADLLRTAVHSLLGLEIVERLSTDLLVLERRKRQAAKSDPERRRLEELEQEASRLEQLHTEAALETGECQTRMDRARKELEAAEDRYINQGGHLLEQLGALKEDRSRQEADLRTAEAELRELAAGALPFAIATDLLAAAEHQLATEIETQQAIMQAALLQTRDEAMMGYLKRQKLSPDLLAPLRDWLQKDRETRQPADPEILFLDATPDDLDEVRQVRLLLPSLQEQATKLIARIRSLQKELDQTDHRLAQVPNDESVAKLHETVNTARSKVQAAEADLSVSIGKRDQLFRELTVKRATYGRELEKHAETEDEADSDQRIIQHSGRVRTTLEAFRAAAVIRRVGQLERLICESFCQLIRKKDFVTSIRIDPETFQVHLIDPKGREMPTSRLSAGESQLLATAMLWGMARASGRVVPTVVDTPLGRLDSSHRRHLVERYFPHAAHQVILLSTDEEINQCHLDHLRPFIGNMYRLQHDSTKRATSIQKGYYFE
jgi:DNA sulfur modification protein DndD